MPSLDPAAGDGLINRRALLGRGIAIAGSVGAGAALTGAAAEPLTDQPWSLAFGSVTPPVQAASRFEKDMARTLSNPQGEFRNSHARTPHHLLGGTVTPSGLHFSINHCGVPDIDRFTLGACQVSTVQALKRKDPGLHLPDNLRGRTAKLPAAMAKLRGCAY